MAADGAFVLTFGLPVFAPGRVAGQGNPSGQTAQSAELGEAQRLHGQVMKLYGEGKYREAIPLAGRSLAIREKALGTEHLDVAS